ncbi:TonB-dependent vitamin B12 receptor, partial [Vibrio anguillarum]|nr:TonB-dependent vitamin B12 receptor [Vibrio anguillarum]
YVDHNTGNPVHSYKEAEVQNSTVAAGVKFNGSELKSEFLVNYQNQDNWNYEKSLGKNSSSATSDELEQLNVQWVNSYKVTSALTLSGGVDWRDEAYIVKPSNTE